MDLKWYYTAKNNGTTEAVATLYKANGCPVLQVYEGRDFYFSRPCGEYVYHVNKVSIPYEVANNFVKKQCSGVPANKQNELKLKFVCGLIEANFDNQVSTILSLFS